MKSNYRSGKVPTGEQGTTDLHLVAAHSITSPPQKCVTTLDTNIGHASQRVNRTIDNDDDLLAVCQDIITHTADNNCNEDNNCDGANYNDEHSWIGCWVSQPEGEQNWKSQEGHHRWGKPEILKAANIMEEQYKFYMVSFLSFM